MEVLLLILAVLIGITSLVCWIIILIEFFRIQGLIALFGLCGLVTFIWGWVKVNEHGKRGVMIVWSVAIVLSLVLNVAVGAIGASTQGY